MDKELEALVKKTISLGVDVKDLLRDAISVAEDGGEVSVYEVSRKPLHREPHGPPAETWEDLKVSPFYAS